MNIIKEAMYLKRYSSYILGIIVLVLLLPTVLAQTKIVGYNLNDPVLYILISTVIILLETVILFCNPTFTQRHKKLLFWLITIPVILSTTYLAYDTIHKNIISVTKGPVHWHADYQIIACGERLDLINPEGIRNKIGISVLHEHDDDRIHVEGVLQSLDEVSFGRYFSVIGGSLSDTGFSYPTNDGMISYINGNPCPDGKSATLKVYVNGKRQNDPATYILSPQSNVPPGDCIIVLFDDSISETTNHICTSWEARGWTYENRGVS